MHERPHNISQPNGLSLNYIEVDTAHRNWLLILETICLL